MQFKLMVNEFVCDDMSEYYQCGILKIAKTVIAQSLI